MANERKFLPLVLLTAGLLLIPGLAHAQPRTFSPLVKKHRQQVVHIGTHTRDLDANVHRQGFPHYREGRQGLGSGFVIDPAGLIVTNYHVVADSEAIEVILENGQKFPAVIVGLDQRTDLALIKIEATGLSSARFGDSNALEVGDWVLAIGNPLGLDYSVTAGIISAKGRNIFQGDNLAYGEFLQTDAAINPGNSGGPLFDLNGRVVGVNTAISNKGFGIGFAVPSNLVVEVVRHLKEHGKVLRGWLGVVIQEVTREVSRSLQLPRRTGGILVEEALSFAPASRAGLRPGDVVTWFGKERVTKVAQLQKLVAFSSPGSRVNITALRRGGETQPWKRVEVTVLITQPPDQVAEGTVPVLQRLGLGVTDLASGRPLPPGTTGVVVERVYGESLAEEMGLEAGDVIMEVGRRPVTSRAGLAEILENVDGERVPFVVRRGPKVLYLMLSPNL